MSVRKLGIAAAVALIAAGGAGASSAADVLDQVLPLDVAGLGEVQSGVGLPEDAVALPDGDTMFEETNSRLAEGRDRLTSGLAKASEAVAAEGGNDKAEAMIAVMPIVYDAIGPATVGALQQGAGGLTQGMGHGMGAALGAAGVALNLPGQGSGGSF
jgi:hypothetical protein